jgi:tricorn protease-like protein
MKRTILISFLILSWAFVAASPSHSLSLFESIKKDDRIMVVLKDVGGGQEFLEYAENVLKTAIREQGGRIINPEIMKKVRADKLLWQAIQDGNASAMAKISTDYGANILIRGSLSVNSLQKFAASWEGTASLSLVAVDTTTAEEIAIVTSDPLGSTLNPAPIEDSPLIAKQMAVKKVTNNVLTKLGVISDEAIKGATTIALEMYDVFGSKSGKATILKFSADGRYLLVGAGRLVEVWGLYEKRIMQEYEIESGKITALSVSPDNKLIAVGDSRGRVHLWNVGHNQKKYKVKRHSGKVAALSFCPGSNTLASAGDDEKIHILNAMAGNEVACLKGHNDTINSIAFTSNGRHLISASNDLTIRWWDVNVARQKKAIQASADKLICMALSLDGSVAALSTVDIHIDLRRGRGRRDVRHIRVIDTVTGEEIRVLEGHKKDVTTLAFHPDKRFLASGSVDNTIRIWDVQKGDIVTFLEQNDDIACVDFSEDGQWFGALSQDQRITVWKLR